MAHWVSISLILLALAVLAGAVLLAWRCGWRGKKVARVLGIILTCAGLAALLAAYALGAMVPRVSHEQAPGQTQLVVTEFVSLGRSLLLLLSGVTGLPGMGLVALSMKLRE